MPFPYARPGSYKPIQLLGEIESAGLPEPMSVCGDGHVVFELELSGPDETLLYATMDAHAVDELKETQVAKEAAINLKTDAMIAAGFMYNSKNFSLSIESQSKMTAAYQIRNEPAMVWPIRWNTRDDQDAHELVDAAELAVFYMTAVGTIRAILDSGTALKDAVRAATTVAEVDAVVDPR